MDSISVSIIRSKRYELDPVQTITHYFLNRIEPAEGLLVEAR